MAKKNFAELNLSDAFLFAVAMENPDTCRLLLEQVLEKKVSGVQAQTERSLFYIPNLRSIRLDVFAEDKEQTGYNLEMENWDKGSLAKRSRFHLAKMDTAALKPGEAFNMLRNSYVIFICTFDPFSKGLYRYTFETKCLEKELALRDGATRIFLNTKGENPQGVSKSLINFLHYVENSSDQDVKENGDPWLREFHERIRALKKSRELEERYMTVGDLIQEAGERERDRLRRLVIRLNQDGESEQLLQILGNEELLEQWYQKYQL